jgi:hypothetical protein
MSSIVRGCVVWCVVLYVCGNGRWGVALWGGGKEDRERERERERERGGEEHIDSQIFRWILR